MHPAKRNAGNSVPLFALGFRPFYLLAGIFAVAGIALWIGIYTGELTVSAYLPGIAWHRHEMIFGFACAVIAGFLLTAVRNWTGQPTPHGAGLAALALLWLSARILILTGPALAAAVIDVAFLPILALSIAFPIMRSANKRNVKLLLVLAGLAGANGTYHLAAFGVLPSSMTAVATTAALDIITILIAIMGGRVIPAFTASAISGANPRHLAPVETVAIGTLLLVFAAGIGEVWWSPPDAFWIALLGTAAIAHALRLYFWQPHTTRAVPLLWMLPVAYAWLPIALGLRAFGYAGLIPPTAAVHALTLGAMSALMLAMMMRSALGHTGRPLSAGIVEVTAFVLIQIATLIRVGATFVAPDIYRGLVVTSGIAWAFALLLFVARYGPWLCQRRVDGQPG